jgi:hypothetical protein
MVVWRWFWKQSPIVQVALFVTYWFCVGTSADILTSLRPSLDGLLTVTTRVLVLGPAALILLKKNALNKRKNKAG